MFCASPIPGLTPRIKAARRHAFTTLLFISTSDRYYRSTLGRENEDDGPIYGGAFGAGGDRRRARRPKFPWCRPAAAAAGGSAKAGYDHSAPPQRIRVHPETEEEQGRH